MVPQPGGDRAFGIEGTGSYGAGVARFLITPSSRSIDPTGQPGRKGKSDPTDAEMAARAVLAGVANATPKSGGGEVEMIRMLKNTKDSAVKSSQSINQMKALVVTAPAELRETLDGLAAGALAIAPASGLALWAIPPQRPNTLSDRWPAATVSSVRRSLRRSWADSPGQQHRPCLRHRARHRSHSGSLPGVTLNASTLRLPSPRSAGSIRYLLRPARPTGIGSTAVRQANAALYRILMTTRPRHTWDAAPGKE